MKAWHIMLNKCQLLDLLLLSDNDIAGKETKGDNEVDIFGEQKGWHGREEGWYKLRRVGRHESRGDL